MYAGYFDQSVPCRQCGDACWFPGLAALASSSEGIAAIYAAKRRQLQSPLAICVGDAFDIPRFAETEHLPRGCTCDFALALLVHLTWLQRAPELPAATTASCLTCLVQQDAAEQ